MEVTFLETETLHTLFTDLHHHQPTFTSFSVSLEEGGGGEWRTCSCKVDSSSRLQSYLWMDYLLQWGPYFCHKVFDSLLACLWWPFHFILLFFSSPLCTVPSNLHHVPLMGLLKVCKICHFISPSLPPFYFYCHGCLSAAPQPQCTI